MIRAWPVQRIRCADGEKRILGGSVRGDAKVGDSGKIPDVEKTPQSDRCVVKIGIVPEGRIHGAFSRMTHLQLQGLTLWA